MFLTQKHYSYFKRNKRQFVLEPNMSGHGLVTQIQVPSVPYLNVVAVP